jgi:Cu-processing system permease protein
MDLTIVWTLAQKEVRDALRNRWFVLFTLVFAGLALSFAYLAVAGTKTTGIAGFSRTAATLVNLVFLIVPLLALTVGAQSIVGEKERGTLSILLAQPISRPEIFAGKYIGLALSLAIALLLGFGVSGLYMTLQGAGNPTDYVMLVFYALILALIMLGLGMVISAITRRAGAANGIAIFLWLVFALLGDLGMMGSAILLRIPIANLFWLVFANPAQVFKLTALYRLNATLDVIGPAGVYATQQYGSALWGILGVTLALWVAVPALVAYFRFAVREN